MPVYFIQAGAAGPIKIGFARDVARRLGNMRVANASPLVLRAQMPGDVGDERALHIRFAAIRIRGEWFEPADPLLEYIAGLPRLASDDRRRGRRSHPSNAPLADWMAANGMDDDALALALDIDRSTASRFRRGKLVPSRKSIDKIVTLTHGAVQPNTFFGLPPAVAAA